MFQNEACKSQIRALIGQTAMQPVPVQVQNVPTSLQTPGRAIIKGKDQSAYQTLFFLFLK